MPAGPLTIYNNLSVSDVIYDRAGNSTDWNNVYSSVATTSANWDNTYTSVSTTSANWDNVYSSVASTSANWDNTYTSVSTTSANWDTVYSTVCALSTSWEETADIIPTVTNYLSTNNVLISSATIASNLQVNSNVLIYGNLSATGTSNFANTIFSTTTALSVVHIGSGPAMWVGNDGTGDIASFYDIDQNIEVLHVGGENSVDGPGVGIRTSFPNKALTVNGEISANNVVYDASGNSLNWNSVYSSVASTSSNWDSTYNTVYSLSSQWDSSYNSVASLSANWQNTYTSVYNTSANWDTVYSTVCALSTSWEESADIIPTVTNYLSTNNVLLSSATITKDLQVNDNVLISSNLSALGNISLNLGKAIGFKSIATNTGTASGDYSHAEGEDTIASGYGSHAEGSTTIASGDYSHAEGGFTTASGLYSHAAGYRAIAAQDYTYAWSDSNIGSYDDVSTTRSGQYMVSASGGVFIPGNVGIGTDSIDNALTVIGDISASQTVFASYVDVIDGNSSNWNSVYTTTNANSANWNLGYDGFTILNSNSANWNDTYTTVQSNSATTWNYQGDDLKALSGEWVGGNIAYTNLIANSAAYLSGVDLSFLSVSANWDSVYTTTNASSANWNLGYDGGIVLAALSSNWETTYTNVQVNSSSWSTVYSTVCALSTSWEESADILPTVTNYLSTNNVLLSSATITDSISTRGSVTASQSIIPVTVTNLNANRMFTDIDTNKIFHFDTTLGALTASFPEILTDGFNVAIMNTGTNYLYISSNMQYNAVGNKLIDRYSGAYVYKSNSQIFAVGGV